MKMPADTYAALVADCRAVLEATERGLGAFSVNHMRAGTVPDREALSMADMEDILMIVSVDRSHVYHPRFEYAGLLPRVLEHDGRSTGWLHDREPAGLGLQDSHIGTALKAVLEVLRSEPSVAQELAPAR